MSKRKSFDVLFKLKAVESASKKSKQAAARELEWIPSELDCGVARRKSGSMVHEVGTVNCRMPEYRNIWENKLMYY